MNSTASLATSLPPVYAAAAVRVGVPVLVLPLMAGRLGADEFGRLGLCLVWAGLLSLVVEGGFLAAATRRAIVGDERLRRALAQQVFSARCALSIPVLLLAFSVGAWITPAADSSGNRWETAILLAVLSCALGWPANWYLQATSQLHRWAWVDLTVQSLLFCASFLFARSVSAYLLLQCLATTAIAFTGWIWLRNDLNRPGQACSAERQLWAAAAVWPGLALGAKMLPVSVIGSAYSLALPAIAASQLGRAELGNYYLADRLVRALVSAADPLMQLIYPRIVERFPQSARLSLAYALRWAAGGLVVGSLIGLAAWIVWPGLQRLTGGTDPAPVNEVIAVLGYLVPLIMGWRFIAYWMLGSGRYDRAYRGCILVGGVVGLGGAWAFGRSAQALAGVALVAELAVMFAAGTGVVVTERLRSRQRRR